MEDREENRNVQLDLQYRQILKTMKGLVKFVNNNSHLERYSIWLRKLSCINDKQLLRNQYLLELARQMKADILKPPFDKLPTEGPLPPLRILLSKWEKIRANSLSRLKKSNTRNKDDVVIQLPPISLPNDITQTKNDSIVDKKETNIAKETEEVIEETYKDNDIGKKQNEESAESNNETKLTKSDWKTRAKTLENTIEDIQNENGILIWLTKTLQKKEHVKKLTELQVEQKMKVKIQEENWKQFKELIKTNGEELRSISKSHEQLINKMMDYFKDQESKRYTKHKEELEQLRKDYAEINKEKISKIEFLERIINEDCAKQANEILVLQEQLDSLSSAIKPENIDKIKVLQDCIIELDQVFHESEREHRKELKKLKREIKDRKNTHQIILQTQKAELVARSNAEKRMEIDKAVSEIAMKYNQLLIYRADELAKVKK